VLFMSVLRNVPPSILSQVPFCLLIADLFWSFLQTTKNNERFQKVVVVYVLLINMGIFYIISWLLRVSLSRGSEMITNIRNYILGLSPLWIFLVGVGKLLQYDIFYYLGAILSCTCISLSINTTRSYGYYLHDKIAYPLQVSNRFMYQVGPLFFLSDDNALVLSMAVLVASSAGSLRLLFPYYSLSVENSYVYKALTFTRRFLLQTVFVTTIFVPEIRAGFKNSIVAHICYFLIRIYSIFITGSVFLNPLERVLWNSKSDIQKMAVLLVGRYPGLNLELLLNLYAIAHFIILQSNFSK